MSTEENMNPPKVENTDESPTEPEVSTKHPKENFINQNRNDNHLE